MARVKNNQDCPCFPPFPILKLFTMHTINKILVMIKLSSTDQNSAFSYPDILDNTIMVTITSNEKTKKKTLSLLFNYWFIPKRNFLIGS